jgi:transcription antitermination factor NusG
LVLERKGYETLLPTYKSRRLWSDRVVEKQLTLFPGYLFVRFDAHKRLPILTTPGVVSVVGCGNEPVPIQEAEIEAIHVLLRSGLLSSPCPFMREGQRVRVKRGSLEGLEGILVTKKSACRVVVSVTLLQRSVSVEVDPEWLCEI